MPVLISLLRAINVGGNNSLPMPVLKELYAELGLEQTQTLLQSGNAVFLAPKTAVSKLGARIEAAIEARTKVRPRVLLRTPSELEQIVADNPFPHYARSEPSRLLVHFLEHAPAKNALAELRAIHAGPEEMALLGRSLYVYFPNGAGASKLTAARMDRGLGTTGTARNWNTLLKLIALAAKLELAARPPKLKSKSKTA